MRYMQKMTFKRWVFCSINVSSQMSLRTLTIADIGENVKHDSFLFGGNIAWLINCEKQCSITVKDCDSTVTQTFCFEVYT